MSNLNDHAADQDAREKTPITKIRALAGDKFLLFGGVLKHGDNVIETVPSIVEADENMDIFYVGLSREALAGAYSIASQWPDGCNPITFDSPLPAQPTQPEQRFTFNMPKPDAPVIHATIPITIQLSIDGADKVVERDSMGRISRVHTDYKVNAAQAGDELQKYLDSKAH